MPETIKSYQCRHIFADGHRCGSKSLRHKSFCYYHHTTRKPAPRRTESLPLNPAETTFDLPFPEDRPSIQLAIGEILRRIANNTLDPRRAGLLLYGLQIASSNLPRQQAPEMPKATEQVEDLELHPTHGPLAPIAEYTEPEPVLSWAAQFLRELEQEEGEQEQTEPAQGGFIMQSVLAMGEGGGGRSPLRTHIPLPSHACRITGSRPASRVPVSPARSIRRDRVGSSD